MIKFLLFYIVVSSSLCKVIYASQLIPQDNLSSLTHEDAERDLLFLPNFVAAVTALQLIHASTNNIVVTLFDQMAIPSAEPSYSVSAVVAGKRTRSVFFEWTFESQGIRTTVQRFENKFPYALCANEKNDFFPCKNLSFGNHIVSAKACSKRNGRGKCTLPFVVSFTIDRSVSTGSPFTPVNTSPVGPNAPLAPSAPKAPAAPMDPTAPAIPTAPTALTAPAAPSVPAAPAAPVAPKTPSAPNAPTAPAAPTVLAVPAAPSAPTAPSAPAAPTTPAAPTVPVAPSAPTAPTEPITYVPGKATVRQNGMLLSEGLTSRLIAQSGTPVIFGNGQKSLISFHTFPDGAAIFLDPSSTSYKYVSNSEASSNAGVGSITFDQFGNVTGYERLQNGTIRNCGGGKTFWNTWLTCEEQVNGHVWEIDPFAGTARRTLLASTYQAPWESAAYDNRDPVNPKFYVTADKSNGALLRFTPSATAVGTARNSSNYLELLHTSDEVVRYDYLVLTQVTTLAGTFSWTPIVGTAEASAVSFYKSCEGLDIRDGFLYMTCKTDKILFILDLDAGTYTGSSTVSGAFNGQPDQVARLLDDVDQDLLYFCEDVGTFAGVHGRDANGKYYTILQAETGLDGETSGLAFGPENMLMYVSFQTAGRIYEIRRTDGRPFSGQRLDIKYHTDANPDPFVP